MIFNVLAMIKLEKLEAGKNNQAKWSFPHQNRMDLKCFKKKKKASQHSIAIHFTLISKYSLVKI